MIHKLQSDIILKLWSAAWQVLEEARVSGKVFEILALLSIDVFLKNM